MSKLFYKILTENYVCWKLFDNNSKRRPFTNHILPFLGNGNEYVMGTPHTLYLDFHIINSIFTWNKTNFEKERWQFTRFKFIMLKEDDQNSYLNKIIRIKDKNEMKSKLSQN